MKPVIHRLFIAAIVICFAPFKLYAACTTYLSSTTINVGTIIVQRDSPPGTVVSPELTGINQIYYTCNDPLGYSVEGGLVSTLTSGGSNYAGRSIFSTNVAGIGLTLGLVGGFSPGQWDLPITNGSFVRGGSANGIGTYNYNWQPKVQFIKTAQTVISGPVNQQLGYFLAGWGSVNAFPNMINKTPQTPLYIQANIVVVQCSITTPTLVFPIGNIMASSFGSTIGSTPSGASVTQNLGLNCDAGANINVSLGGTQNPDTADSSVLALAGQGSAGVASGVGVQLLYNGSPLKLNNRIVLKQSPGGQETFPLTARYYQTRTAVGTGSANTTATLNLTYQ